MIGQFFINLWDGIVANKDVIIATITSAQFIAFVSTLVSLFKSNKNTKSNTESNAKVAENLEKLSSLEQCVKTSTEEVKFLKSELSTAKEEVNSLKEQNNMLLTKFTGLLDALSVVYSASIKDTETRTTVVNILNNAKNAETNRVNELKSTIEELKKKVNTKVESIGKEVDKEIAQVVEVAETVLNGVKETNVMRY